MFGNRNCDEYHNILQNDSNSLYEWSVSNKMKFHPQKCKVLSVTNETKPIDLLPFNRFVYCLDNVCLDYVDYEKDLRVHINTKLNWKQHVFYLCSKANRMLGLVKCTCHFVKNPLQKRVFILP